MKVLHLTKDHVNWVFKIISLGRIKLNLGEGIQWGETQELWKSTLHLLSAQKQNVKLERKLRTSSPFYKVLEEREWSSVFSIVYLTRFWVNRCLQNQHLTLVMPGTLLKFKDRRVTTPCDRIPYVGSFLLHCRLVPELNFVWSEHRLLSFNFLYLPFSLFPLFLISWTPLPTW